MSERMLKVLEFTLFFHIQQKNKQIEVEAEKSNFVSIRVPEKSDFVPNGRFGQDGIIFVWKG